MRRRSDQRKGARKHHPNSVQADQPAAVKRSSVARRPSVAERPSETGGPMRRGKRFRRAAWLMLSASIVFGVHYAVGTAEEETVAQNLNVPLPTLGGTQFWTDYVHRDGYRIQKNALTGHWRLLDPGNTRRAWGSREDVDAQLEALRPQSVGGESGAAPRKLPAVVLVHGLMRTDHSMKSLEERLRQEGYGHVIRFGYASTRQPLADSAAALREVLEGQPQGTEFCFVGHSMGNILVRHVLGDARRDGDPKKLLPRCHAMVMLGPPNNGAMIAKRLGSTGVFGWVAGPGALELGPNWDDVASKLDTPAFPFAIVAGNVPAKTIRNPLVEGDSDFVVCVEEARLEGAEVFREVPILHSFLMNDPDIQDWTIEFLQRHLEEDMKPKGTTESGSSRSAQ